MWLKTKTMKILFLIVTYFVSLLALNAQKTHTFTLSFLPIWKKERLVLDKNYVTENDTISISKLKFYISNVEFFNENKSVFSEKNSFHLIDIEKEKTLQINLQIPDNVYFTHLKINIGIDSTTQISGAMGSDLDPTNGMYWTWQSGYINFKLEGKSARCKARKNEFQFHIGGYASPFNSLQTRLFLVKEKNNLELKFDVFEFLKNINLEKTHHIMSPSLEAVEIAKSSLNPSEGGTF